MKFSKEQMYFIIKQFYGNANVLTIPHILIKKFNGHYPSAVFLSQLVYWSDKGKSDDGYIYKSYKDWAKELCISTDTAKAIKKRLEDMGLIETKIKKINGAPTLHYKINEQAFVEFISKKDEDDEAETNAIIDTITDTTTNETTKIITDTITEINENAAIIDKPTTAVDAQKVEKNIIEKNKINAIGENPMLESEEMPLMERGKIPYSLNTETTNKDYNREYIFSANSLPTINKNLKLKNKPLENKLQEKQSKQIERLALRERNPKNNLEKIEKEYLENYDMLFKSGFVKTKEPIVNWGQVRKLEKQAIANFGFDIVFKAVIESVENAFVVNSGYSLAIILSAGVLNQLINSNRKSIKAKYDFNETGDTGVMPF